MELMISSNKKWDRLRRAGDGRGALHSHQKARFQGNKTLVPSS